MQVYTHESHVVHLSPYLELKRQSILMNKTFLCNLYGTVKYASAVGGGLTMLSLRHLDTGGYMAPTGLTSIAYSTIYPLAKWGLPVAFL